MNRSLLSAMAITVLLNQFTWAEEDRSGIIDEHNKTSSSFVVDPDPLDPLPVKKENIKEGDEIVLDDIRQVIDSPPRKKSEIKSTSQNQNSQKRNSSKSQKSKNRISKTSVKSSRTQTKKSFVNLNPDDPDMKLEDQMHRTYQKYNVQPTSSETWGQATASQKENIYVVQKHDTLFTISKMLFGDSKFWPKIWALNRADILNPHQIRPGMKIHFFAGDVDNLPTLSIDQKSSYDDKNPYFVQQTEFQRFNTTEGIFDKSNFPMKIPESLPLTRNGKYYAKNEKQDQIDLKAFEYVDQFKPTNPYILTTTELKSDFTIDKEQTPFLMCKDGQFVPVVNRKNDEALLPGRYLIVQKLSNDGAQLKKTIKYKTVGDVTINDQNQMRVNNCRDLMNLDSILVSQEKLANLNEPDEAFDFSARIIDGLEYPGQNYYADNQYLVMNVDGLNLEGPKDLSIFSDDLGKKVGTLRILKRTGTMAIAIVVHATDVINRGDKIKN